jgi:dynamin 1-like protein
MSIKDAIEMEREFFEKHPIYSSYSDKLGIGYLSRSMNKILCTHILKCIPNLSQQINELLSQKERELN